LEAFIISEAKYRRDIQVLRGLAVLAVVLFHAKESYFPLGYLGVDAFFVISGFVVTPLILRIFTDTVNGEGRFSNLKSFYKRRFYRLAPALAVTLVISAMSIFLLGPVGDHQRVARQGIATVLLAGNVGAYRYSGDYSSPNPNPLVHTWSLSVEEQIYIFLPLILILIIRNRKSIKKTTAVILWFISTVSFVSFLFPAILQPLYSQAGIALASEFSFYSSIDRIWQFTVGGLAFLLLDRYQKSRRNLPKGIHLLTVIAFVIILFGPIHISLKANSILASLFAVVIILFKSLEVLPDFLIKKLEWVGDRSYSIYLVHMPLLYLAKYSPVTQIGKGENRIIQITIAVIASIMLGSLSFSTIENRFRNRDKSYLISIKNLAMTLSVTLWFPFMLFFIMDRIAVSYRPDISMPVLNKTLPWEWDSKCQVMGAVSKIERPCVYGNQESDKTILLIGDSHAASNSGAIIEVAQTNNMKVSVFTQSSCPFIINKSKLSATYELPGLDVNCMQHNQEILDYINVQRPTYTILSMRSTSQYIFPNTTSSRSLYRNSILHSLSNLTQSKTNIILIGAEPEYIPIETWAQMMLGTKGKYSDIPIEDMRWWRSISLANFYYINSIKIYCPQNQCKNKLGSIWLFNDDNHLSVEGAKLLVPELDSLITEIIDRNP
jgi:peptidoglycan/LPS O-acetylase OafA/YrhL